MLIEAHVDAKRVLAFMHAFLNVGRPIGAFSFDILGLAERLFYVPLATWRGRRRLSPCSDGKNHLLR